MSNRSGHPPQPSRYESSADPGPLDEDAVPMAAAALAAVTDPVPVHAPPGAGWLHAGRLLWRAGGLIAIAILARLPVLLNAGLPDGEADALRRGPPPMPAWADAYRLPLSLVHYPQGVPRLLAWLVRAESLLADTPLSHLVVGLALHAAVAVLLWLTLRRLTRPGAWLAAAAFAVYPGSVAAVGWIDQRGRPWAALFAVAGVLLMLRARGVPARPAAAHDEDEEDLPTGWHRFAQLASAPLAAVAAAVLLVAAALCQPTVAGAALAGAVLIAWRRWRDWRPADWALPAFAVVLAGAVAVGVARGRPPSRLTPFGHDPVAALSAPLRAMWQVGRAVEQSAWPDAAADLAVPRSRPAILATCGVGIAFWAGLALVALLWRRLGVGPAVAAGCFALLLPTVIVPNALALLPTDRPPGNPAAAYLCAVPLLAVFADAVVAAARRVRADLAQRLAEVAAAAAAVGAMGVATAVRSPAIRDSDGVYRTFVAVDGGTWSARGLLAEHYLHDHHPDAAQTALAGLTPERCPDAATAITQGDLLMADGDVSGAMPWYALAGRLDPSDVTGTRRRALAFLRLGRTGDANLCYLEGISAHPDSTELHMDFGGMLYAQRDLESAAEQFRQALRVDPDLVSAHVNLANCLIGQGDLSGAAGHLQTAVTLDPDNYDAYHNAGFVLAQMRAYGQSEQMLREAVRRRPDVPEARNDLGVVLIAAGKYKQAEFELGEALRLRPDYAEAKANLGVAQRREAAQRQRANVEGK